MPVAPLCRLLFALPLLLLQGAPVSARDAVTIYRCTDAQGRLALRDTPCARGQEQQTREMTRPTDPPARPAPARAPAPAPAREAVAAAPPPRVVVMRAPQPLYECTTPDGDTYTSQTDQGDPRWVPLWTLGYPAIVAPGTLPPPIGGPGHRLARAQVDSLGSQRRPRPRPGGPGIGYPGVGYAYPAGTWVRDICYPLPQQEVCDRLSDRRYELDRRYNSALQSERQRITIEQRGIDARLATDCGIR